MPRPKKAKPVEPAAPVPKQVRIYAAMPNPTWLRASDEDGNACFVQVPKSLSGNLLGKVVAVESIDGMGKEYYKYTP